MIESVLDENAQGSFKSLRRPANLAAIVRFETAIGKKLPRDLVGSLLIHDGMRSDRCFVNFMRLLPISQIHHWWAVQCRVQKMAEFGGNPHVQTSRIKNDVRWRTAWV